MSIIDQASAESSRRYNADTTIPEASRWRRDTRAAFMDGVRWLLDQLTDPDQATVDAVARAIFGCRDWTEGDWDNLDTAWPPEDVRDYWRDYARAAITALTNHLNGADHE